MNTDKKSKKTSSAPLYLAISWIVTLLIPVAIVLTGVRLLFFPAYLDFEYNTPGFPADPYGFSLEDRLHWSKIAMEYLLNKDGIEFLGDLRFENGAPVYNERELSHMVDVKNAIKMTFNVWYLSLAGLLGLGVWAWRGGWGNTYRSGVSRGGWLTVILIAAILVFVFAAFGVFFVAFHNVFFQPGTWMFEFSDTLIRLFPERFWRDIFIYVGAFVLVVGLALGFGLRQKK